MTKTDLNQLRHEPYGWENPYIQWPYERPPREPQAGQPVLLGVTTIPGTITAVYAEWWLENNQKTYTVHGAQLKQQVESGEVWQVVLPPFAAGDRVNYQLFGQAENELIQSQIYAFAVSHWTTITRLVQFACYENEVAIDLALAEGEPIVTLKLGLMSNELLRLEWVVQGETAVPAAPTPSSKFELIQEDDHQIVLQTSRLEIVVQRAPFTVKIANREGQVILQESAAPAFLVDGNGRIARLKQQFVSPADEKFWGFGERFNALNQRGNSIDVRVYEEYKNQGKRTYMPMPFFVSSQLYGHYLDTSYYVRYDLADADPNQWAVEADMSDLGQLTAYLITAPTPWQIVAAFAHLTSKPVLPPPWAFGLWMSGNDWNSQALVMQQVQLTQQHQIPATIMVIEAWSDEVNFYIWNDAQYAPKPAHETLRYADFTFPEDGHWPDPKGMIDQLHADNMRLLLWQIPVLKKLQAGDADLGLQPQRDMDEAYMIEHGYCVRQANGEPYRIPPIWFAGSLVMDFTNPEGVNWWLSRRAYLLDEMGVDGFKTDGGEHLWGLNLQFSDGRRGAEVWNLYPNLYQKAYYGFANERRNHDAILFSRAGFTGTQAYPCHWAGDENSTWEAFRASILAGLSAGISGISFWGWDIGGFSGEIPTAELYLRSTAMAAFCPIMQYHSEYNGRKYPSRDRTPWNIQERTGDQNVLPIFRHFANLRMNLLPYILSEAWHSSQTGIPLMRALSLEYPQDPICNEFAYQYLFGTALLIAPVTEPGEEVWEVYLPDGRWHDFWTGQVYEGHQKITYPVPANCIPVFVRTGSILPFNLDETVQLGSPVGNNVGAYDHLCFKIFMNPDAKTVYEWYDSVSQETFVWEAEYLENGHQLRLTIPPLAYPAIVKLAAGVPAQIMLEGKQLPRVYPHKQHKSAAENCWMYSVADEELLISLLPDGNGYEIIVEHNEPG